MCVTKQLSSIIENRRHRLPKPLAPRSVFRPVAAVKFRHPSLTIDILDSALYALAHAARTKTSLVDRHMISSMPADIIASDFSMNPGKCLAEHVRVNAPGTPNRTARLPPNSRSLEIALGASSTSVKSSTFGMRCPTVIILAFQICVLRRAAIALYFLANLRISNHIDLECIRHRSPTHASPAIKPRLTRQTKTYPANQETYPANQELPGKPRLTRQTKTYPANQDLPGKPRLTRQTKSYSANQELLGPRARQTKSIGKPRATRQTKSYSANQELLGKPRATRQTKSYSANQELLGKPRATRQTKSYSANQELLGKPRVTRLPHRAQRAALALKYILIYVFCCQCNSCVARDAI